MAIVTLHMNTIVSEHRSNESWWEKLKRLNVDCFVQLNFVGLWKFEASLFHNASLTPTYIMVVESFVILFQ